MWGWCKILIDTDSKQTLADGITLKNVLILVSSVIKDVNNC